MRVTNQLIYSNFKRDYERSSNLMYDLNNQISSGHKIQNSFDDSSVYIDSSRLEYEKTSLSQVKDSSKSAQTFANNSDTALNEFNDKLIDFKTKLIQAANETHDETSLNAIADDLEAIKENLKDIANTSINGKFLFSGTAFGTKPIDDNGNYQGNGNDIKATTGTDVSLTYNIDGESLFLGSDADYNKILSSNVRMYSDDNQTFLKSTDSIKDIVENNGDDAGDIGSQTNAYFYLQAKNSDGSSIKKKIQMSVDDSVENLLNNIKESFSPQENVDVALNDLGQIVITDKNNGSKSIDFSLIGAVDKDGGGDANVTDIDDLAAGSNVNILSFTKSNYTQTSDAASEALSFDRNYFKVDGDKLTSNISQVDKTTNAYATNSTKLVNASGLETLNGTSLTMKLTNVYGVTKDVTLNFNAASSDGTSGSTFTIDGNTYNIYNAKIDPNDDSVYVADGDEMTYKQLNDVISMVVSDQLPATTNSKSDYDTAISNANNVVETSLDYKGRMQIVDKLNATTKVEFSMYDSSSDDFGSTTGNSLSFMSNDFVTIDEPSVDIFKDLDDMITAVRNGTFNMDANSQDPRNLGIENSIRRVEHLRDHVSKLHTKIGSLSNALDGAYKRSDMLELQVTTLQSDVADADVGEALAKYNQVSVSFQALLSTISKVNQISLLNYL